MNPYIPDVERINAQDFPGADENMKKLITWLTRFSEPVFKLINTLTETGNTLVVKTADFSGFTTSQLPANFTTTSNLKSLWLGSIQEQAGNYKVIGTAIFPEWYQNGSTVTITGITGLNPAKTYNLTVVYI